ncbi:MAG: Mor transcription activator family protein [Thiohalomonadaceae bacterium]
MTHSRPSVSPEIEQNELTAAVKDIVKARVQLFGLRANMAEDCANAVLEDLLRSQGGDSYYLPKLKPCRLAALADFTGDNYAEVCTQHGITRRTLRRWLQEESEK